MTVQYVLIDDGYLYNCTKNVSVPSPLSFLSIVKKKETGLQLCGFFCCHFVTFFCSPSNH